MKPVAVINVTKIADHEIDQPLRLRQAGYEVIFTTDGPGVMLHAAPETRRERIAAAVLAGIFAGRADQVNVNAAVDAAIWSADHLIEELDK